MLVKGSFSWENAGAGKGRYRSLKGDVLWNRIVEENFSFSKGFLYKPTDVIYVDLYLFIVLYKIFTILLTLGDETCLESHPEVLN